ncbi:leucine-rich repeat domain-containing protein, partial [Listeria grandensis]|uniref:leucine-rich repeat domain-containing protein n=1 Tax=Listeria grandensis TaxID=1494963 RepID=UPI00164E93CF
AEGNEGGRIQQLAPLASMKNLEHLTLRNEFIQDLTPLAKLTQLQSLDLSMNRITSVQALQGLTQLQTLRLTGNQVTDFRPLEALPAVQAKDTAHFEALAQTIQAEETKATGETSQLNVYTPEGEKIPATVASSQGEVQAEDGVKWLQPGEQQIQYQDTEGQIVAFLQQEVVGDKIRTTSVKPRAMAGMSAIQILDAQGNIIDQSSYTMMPGSMDVAKLANSDMIEEAIKRANQELPNTQKQRGTVRLPNGDWYVKNKISLLEGVALEGQGKTTLYRIVGDFIQSSIAHIDGIRYYDALIDMESNTKIRNLTLDGLQSPDKVTTDIQGGITAKGNYGEGSNPQAPTAKDYLQNLTIEDVAIQNMAGSGVTIDLAKNVTIRGTTAVTVPNHAMKVENVKDDGIIGYSVENMRVENTLTRTIGHMESAGKPAQRYNVCATMRKMQHPDPGLAYYVRYPNSRDVTFQHNVVLDNPYWEGLDGHSVQGMTIAQNVVVGVDRAIVVGGQDYSKNEALPVDDKGYYYPSQDVTITNNRINQAVDRQTWQPKNQTKSQVGIAVWGTTHVAPGPRVTGYTNGVVQGNAIDAIEPRGADTPYYGAIALKLVGNKAGTENEAQPQGMQVTQNTIGKAADNSVQLAGISSAGGTRNTTLTSNHIGAIGSSSPAAQAVIGKRTHAPITLRESDNTMTFQHNIIANQNAVMVQDDKYGIRSNMHLEGRTTNQWEDPKDNAGRQQDTYSYAITNVQWDGETGTVTGNVGNQVGAVEIHQGSRSAVLANNQQVVANTYTRINPATRTFRIQSNALKGTNYRELYLVANNDPINLNPITNISGHIYKVNLQAVQQGAWYAITPQAYDVQQDTRLQVNVGALIKQVRVVEYPAEGSNEAMTVLQDKVPVDQTSMQFDFQLPNRTKEDVYRAIWIEGYDAENNLATTQKLPLQDAAGFKVAPNLYNVDTVSLRGTVGPLVNRIRLSEDGIVKRLLAISNPAVEFVMSLKGHVTPSDNRAIQLSSYDKFDKLRQTTNVECVKSGMGMTIPTYDLSQSELTGTLEPNHAIAKVHIQVNGKTVQVVDIPPGTQTFRGDMTGKIPSALAEVTLLPEDKNGYIWQKYQATAQLVDTRYDLALDTGAAAYFYGKTNVTGKVNSSLVGRIEMWVDGVRKNNYAVLEGSGTFMINMAGRVPSATSQITAKIYDRATDTLQKEQEVPMLPSRPS